MEGQIFDLLWSYVFHDLGHGLVQLVQLIFQQRLVDNLLGDVVLENVAQAWFGRLQAGKVAPEQRLHILRQHRHIALHWVGLGQQIISKDAPDHAGDLQCQLYRLGQAVEAG